MVGLMKDDVFTVICAQGIMCVSVSKACTKPETILRCNPVMTLVLGQIEVVSLCS